MDGCLELNKVRALYDPRKPPVEGEAEPPWKWARPAGLPSFGPASVSSFAGVRTVSDFDIKFMPLSRINKG